MLDDLKCCYNLTCQRYRIGTTGKFCTKCGQEMRSFGEGPRVGDFDTPPEGLIRGHNLSKRERKLLRRAQQEKGSIWLPGYENVQLPDNGGSLSFAGGSAMVVIDKPNGHGAAKASGPKDWTCDAGQVEGCPIAKAPEVHVPVEMFDEWVMLADTFDTEWIAYLTGHQTDNGTWVIDSYYFPKQQANGAHCNVIEGLEGKDECQPGTIGSVHSHVRMGAFFSGEDKAHFNHPVEMVVNARGECKANVAIKLQCGHPSRMDTKVFTLGDRPEAAKHPKVVELEGKITKQQVSASTQAHNWGVNEGGGAQYVREDDLTGYGV